MFRLFSKQAENILTKATKKNQAPAYPAELNAWKIWKGQVSGTESDIKKALKTLNRNPHNSEELSKLIREQRQALLREDLEDAHKNFKKFGY